MDNNREAIDVCRADFPEALTLSRQVSVEFKKDIVSRINLDRNLGSDSEMNDSRLITL